MARCWAARGCRGFTAISPPRPPALTPGYASTRDVATTGRGRGPRTFRIFSQPHPFLGLWIRPEAGAKRPSPGSVAAHVSGSVASGPVRHRRAGRAPHPGSVRDGQRTDGCHGRGNVPAPTASPAASLIRILVTSSSGWAMLHDPTSPDGSYVSVAATEPLERSSRPGRARTRYTDTN